MAKVNKERTSYLLRSCLEPDLAMLFTLKLAERCSGLGEALMLVSGTVRY